MTDLKFIIDPDWKAITAAFDSAHAAREAAYRAYDLEPTEENDAAQIDAHDLLCDVANRTLRLNAAGSLEGLALKGRAVRVLAVPYLAPDGLDDKDYDIQLLRSLLDDLDGGARA